MMIPLRQPDRKASSCHAGNAFAPSSERCRKSHTVHGGKVFAFASWASSKTIMTLDGDVLCAILGHLVSNGEVHVLFDVLTVCKQLSCLARDLLIRVSVSVRIEALIRGQLPVRITNAVERQAARSAFMGELTDETLSALMKYATDVIGVALPQSWSLLTDLGGEDRGNDSFRLLGFDASPMRTATCSALKSGTPSGSGLVPEWYAVNHGYSLRQVHLPCVLGGPLRSVARAGSTAQQKAVRRVPLEICCVVQRPAAEELTAAERMSGGADAHGRTFMPHSTPRTRGWTLVEELFAQTASAVAIDP